MLEVDVPKSQPKTQLIQEREREPKSTTIISNKKANVNCRKFPINLFNNLLGCWFSPLGKHNAT
jgi:hypothetical protein